MKIQSLSTSLLLCLLIPTASFARDAIVVWNLQSLDVPASYIKTLTSVFVSEIVTLGKYEVYCEDNISTVSGWREDKNLPGCTHVECLRALGRLDIAKLISGRIGRIGNTYALSLNLYDNRMAKLQNSVSGECNSNDELIHLARQKIRTLLGEKSDPLGDKRNQSQGEKESKLEESPTWPIEKFRGVNQKWGASISEFRFFEFGDGYKFFVDKVQYRTDFPKEQTRFVYVQICWRRAVAGDANDIMVPLKTKVVLYDPPGNVCYQDASVDMLSWRTDSACHSLKMKCDGSWQVGVYKVEVYSDDELFFRDSFRIY